MTNSLLEIKPLCWLKDKDDNIFFKEITYENLRQARTQKDDIGCTDLKGKKYTLTHYEIQKYWEADIIDHFLYFVLPKEDKIIRDRFHMTLSNMTKRQKEELTYESVEKWIENQKKQESYYSR